MNQIASLSMTDEQYGKLYPHLFPGDGLEAAAILICRRVGSERERLIVRSVDLVNHGECERASNLLSWPGRAIKYATSEAKPHADTIILLHSHPGGLLEFSRVDNDSSRDTMPALHTAVRGADMAHGSAVMTPDGGMIARLCDKKLKSYKIPRIYRAGTDIIDLTRIRKTPILPFSGAMTDHLSELTACVIGVSGTGSLVAEQLARLGVGRLILIDFDKVEDRNLNRIINATCSDAEEEVLKTHVAERAITSHHPETKVKLIDANIESPDAIIAASSADVLFSCMDKHAGRSIAERISSTCLIPLIDVGVDIPPREKNGVMSVADICYRIDYVRPGGPSLIERKSILPHVIGHEERLGNAPEQAAAEIKAGYMRDFSEASPAVITLNMRAASAAVHEWLCRLFKLRLRGNAHYAQTITSLASCKEKHRSEADFTFSESPRVGRGLIDPLLSLPRYAPQKKEIKM